MRNIRIFNFDNNGSTDNWIGENGSIGIWGNLYTWSGLSIVRFIGSIRTNLKKCNRNGSK